MKEKVKEERKRQNKTRAPKAITHHLPWVDWCPASSGARNVFPLNPLLSLFITKPDYADFGWDRVNFLHHVNFLHMVRGYVLGLCWKHSKMGEERKGKFSEWWRLSSQVTVMRDEALLSWRWLETCLLMGGGEQIPRLALLVCTTFALLKCFYLNIDFRTFTLAVLFPIPLGGTERVVGIKPRQWCFMGLYISLVSWRSSAWLYPLPTSCTTCHCLH